MKFGLQLGREAGHSGLIPPGWRMAWYEPRRRVGVFLPPPFHALARAWRELRYRVRLAFSAPSRECADVFAMQREHRERRHLAEEYARGYVNGWGDSYRECLAVVESELSGHTGDVWSVGAILADADSGPRDPSQEN